jgi:hypothetical protein
MYSDTYNTNGNLGSILLLKICLPQGNLALLLFRHTTLRNTRWDTVGHSHTRQHYIKRLINR